MRILNRCLRAICICLFLGLPAFVLAAEIDPFVGTYSGTANFTIAEEARPRDMSTTIEATKQGFIVNWTSVIYRANGKTRENSYKIEFVPSQRDHIYGSAMKTNMFGKQTPLDPLQGEPFVWSRFEGNTFSVFSLFINQVGEYELQEFHRTLAEGGLDLVFRRVSNGVPQKEIEAFLARE